MMASRTVLGGILVGDHARRCRRPRRAERCWGSLWVISTTRSGLAEGHGQAVQGVLIEDQDAPLARVGLLHRNDVPGAASRESLPHSRCVNGISDCKLNRIDHSNLRASRLTYFA